MQTKGRLSFSDACWFEQHGIKLLCYTDKTKSKVSGWLLALFAAPRSTLYANKSWPVFVAAVYDCTEAKIDDARNEKEEAKGHWEFKLDLTKKKTSLIFRVPTADDRIRWIKVWCAAHLVFLLHAFVAFVIRH
jgi:hypothetical protein